MCIRDSINYIPAPEGDENGPMQMLVSSIDYNDYVGRIAIGRVERGVIRQNQDISVCNFHDEETAYKGKIANLYEIEALSRVPCEEAKVGDIVCVSGIEGITIGDTICQADTPEAIEFVKISEPTLEMTFSVNDSPFAGREGKFVTSRQLHDRLFRELLRDVSLRVYPTDTTDSFRVCGRGEMHLSILIETMRREGFEFQVGCPKVMTKDVYKRQLKIDIKNLPAFFNREFLRSSGFMELKAFNSSCIFTIKSDMICLLYTSGLRNVSGNSTRQPPSILSTTALSPSSRKRNALPVHGHPACSQDH